MNNSYCFIDHVITSGLNSAIIASGYPMQTQLNPDNDLLSYDSVTAADMKRAVHLGNAKPCSGHDCYLKGINVLFDLTFTRQAWLELMRYHFIDIVSSESTMHCLPKMKATFIQYTDERVKKAFLEILKEYTEDPTEENWQKLIYSYPVGLLLTARVTTNYLQLKSIYAQRRHHRLPEWQKFCDWIEQLPDTKELGVISND